jgi:hypothetical protein
MGALLRKELRELRWLLPVLWLLLALAQFALLRNARLEGSPMVAFTQVVEILAPLMALVLVNRLVVREYLGRTQLFLETLPISRAQVIATKWLLGAALLLLPMALCLLWTLLAARAKVDLTPQFVALVVARSSCFVLFFYALAFFIGLCGRYRYLIWIALVAFLMIADTRMQLPPYQWAPLHLVQKSMAFERSHWPLKELLITAGAALALVAATMALALAAQGSLVVALSRRMSPREKAAVTMVFMALLTILSVVEDRKEKPAFELARASHSDGGATVAVGKIGDRGVEQLLANRLAGDLDQLQRFLALERRPALAVVPDTSLDPDVFQRAALPNADGVVLRGAYNDEQFDLDGFRAYAMSAWLHWYTHERAGQEDRRWLLDGLTQSMAARDLPQQQDKLALRAAVAARLLHARHASIDSALGQWMSVREQLGPCLGDALAWRMVTSLSAQMGAAQFQALSRRALIVPPSSAVHDALLAPTMAQLLAQSHGPDLAALARAVEALGAAEQRRLGARLDAIVLPAVTFAARRMDGRSYEVGYTVDAAAAPFAVRYTELQPWSAELSNAALARVDAAGSGVLPASFARGTRLFTAVERDDPQLGCKVRLAAQRWSVQ